MPEQRFKSKVDRLMLLICFGPMAAVVLAGLAGVRLGRSPSGGVNPVMLVIMALLALTMRTTQYVVTDEALTVWVGPFRRRRPIRDITRLRSTRSIESSPAWSFDRIEIATTRGFWLNISPADKAGFVRAIRSRAPHVSLDAPLAALAQ